MMQTLARRLSAPGRQMLAPGHGGGVFGGIGVRGLSIERIDHAALGVRDLKVSQRWWSAVLGLENFRSDDPYFQDPDISMVRNGSAFIALLRLPEGEAPLRGSRSQKGHVAFRVSNEEYRQFKASLPALLKQQQVHEEQPLGVEEEDYGVQRSLFFHDPDGNEVEVTTWDSLESKENDRAAFLRKALLLDVRTLEEFQELALPKSILVPHTDFLEGDGVDRVLAAVEGDRDAPIAVYCRAGRRSLVAKAALEARGFTNIQDWVNVQTIVQAVGQSN